MAGFGKKDSSSDSLKETQQGTSQPMKEEGYEAHLFICTNTKANGECCGPLGSNDLRSELKAVAKQRWGGRVRINTSGCLDRCSEGIAAVLYPQGIWKTGLTRDNGPELEKLISENLK